MIFSGPNLFSEVSSDTSQVWLALREVGLSPLVSVTFVEDDGSKVSADGNPEETPFFLLGYSLKTASPSLGSGGSRRILWCCCGLGHLGDRGERTGDSRLCALD